MKKKKEKTKLELFLRKKRAWSKIVRNTNELKCNGVGIKNVTSIDRAFMWDCSPEGKRYWDKLHDEFNKLNS